MPKSKATTNAHYNLNYHLVWIPKYRRCVLKDAIKEKIEQIIKEIAEGKGLEVLAMEIMPDHIHLFVSSPPQNSPSLIVNWFKGISSNLYNQRFATRKEERIRWAHGFYSGSAGTVTEETIKKYIEEQTRCRDTSVASDE